MEIEFKNLDDRIEIIEHTIRTTKLDIDGEAFDQATQHLQARLFINDFDGDCLNCSISYYSENNEFLGLDDSGSMYLTPANDKSIAISLPVDIPANATKSVVRFIFDDEVSEIAGFYSYVLKALSILGLIWLAVTIFNNFK